MWAVIIAHLCEFQITRPNHSDVRLRAIHQGISSSALYLEAEHELSLAAYLAEIADIIGKGSLELFEKLAAAVADRTEQSYNTGNTITISPFSSLGLATELLRASQAINSQICAIARRSVTTHGILDERQSSSGADGQSSNLARSDIQSLAHAAPAARLCRRH